MRRRAPGLRGAVAAVVAAIALAALTGCAAIPMSGAVQSGGTVQDDPAPDIEYRPSGPVKGSDQETILRAFIGAGTGSQDNYAVAREFLSAGFAERWNPRASVTVRQGSGATVATGPRRMSYTVIGAATVDADGRYTQAVDPTSSTLTFQFTKEHGQWRISYAPNGIVLSSTAFESVFQSHALYFFDPTYKFLVPDERWFLARSSTSTRIASALLDGPSDWMKGAVVSAFPEGTQLSLNAVTVDNGTAQVDLTSDALKASTLEKVRMREQLNASLSTVASISSVQVTVEGTSLPIPDTAGTTAVRDPDVDSRPLVVTDQTAGNASGSSVQALPSIGEKIAALHPTGLEVTGSGADAAVGTATGTWVVRTGSSAPLRVDSRPGLIAPSIDDLGFVWSAQGADPRSVIAYGLGGDPHTIASTLPTSGRLVAFRVSRDSTRALALLDTDDGPALYVVAILRDAQKVPTAFGPPVRVQSASGQPVDATWQSDVDIASVGTTSTGASVTSSMIGGQSTILTRPSGTATTIVDGGSANLLLRMSDGRLLTENGGGWDDAGVTAGVLGTQR